VTRDDLREAQIELARLKHKDARIQRYAEQHHDRMLALQAEVWEAMRALGEPSITIEGVAKVTAKDATWYAAVQDRGALHAWAKANRPSLLRQEENKALLNALVRERIRDGQPLPPGLGAYPRKSVNVRRA
jgi:hypothetical protein